jgi:phospholipase C
LVILYSHHGGFYDHVPPPRTISPDDIKVKPEFIDFDFDFKRLGVRVPAVIVSKFIAPGTIDHNIYDHTSVIATARKLFLKDAWADSFLSQRDRYAQTFEHLLTLTTPRTDDVLAQTPSAK